MAWGWRDFHDDAYRFLYGEVLSPARTEAGRLVRLMTARFDQVFNANVRQAAEALGLTVRQTVTLASIVEKEASRPEERPVRPCPLPGPQRAPRNGADSISNRAS